MRRTRPRALLNLGGREGKLLLERQCRDEVGDPSSFLPGEILWQLRPVASKLLVLATYLEAPLTDDGTIKALAEINRSLTELVEVIRGHGERPTQTTPLLEAGAEAMSVEEISKLLGVSKGLIYLRARSGEIPAHKVGSRIIFLRKEVEGWLALTMPNPLRRP